MRRPYGHLGLGLLLPCWGGQPSFDCRAIEQRNEISSISPLTAMSVYDLVLGPSASNGACPKMGGSQMGHYLYRRFRNI
jgi:hypothetical protein